MIRKRANKQLKYFPFYKVDTPSWELIRGKCLYDVWNELEEHIMNSILSEEVELLQLISIDSNDCLTNSDIIAVGTADYIHAKIRYVAEKALQSKPKSIILAHSHTNGNIKPSWDDVTYTKGANHALNCLGISLIDHFIATPHHLFSMRRNCLIF